MCQDWQVVFVYLARVRSSALVADMSSWARRGRWEKREEREAGDRAWGGSWL